MTRRRSEKTPLVVVTPEERPLALFGSRASHAVADLLRRRRIEVMTGARVREDDDGRLVLDEAATQQLEPERVVALPLLAGEDIAGLPADDDGFLPVDDSCRVPGAPGVLGAGDGTTFPIKQGGLATQQADSVAEQIAAGAGAAVEPRPFRPVLRGSLLTGEETLHARRELDGDEPAGVASADYLWWPPHKIGGRYLPACGIQGRSQAVVLSGIGPSVAVRLTRV
jgi:sulfide:quinone oxidoreductase